MDEFVKWPKIPRLNRDCIITEKIDGTNGVVYIEHKELLGSFNPDLMITETDDFYLFAGSRNRWLTYDKDNYGFFRWVYNNREDLINLGPGRHFGEWWGQGVQRKYGLDHKRFSLFNTSIWTEKDPEGGYNTTCPDCCHVVPILIEIPFTTGNVRVAIDFLKENGSVAAPGFDNPEGIVVYHTAANQMFKVMCKNDDLPKGLVN